ncbi:MAG: MauE/DoxX family redox-associated membrane protein [Planctomycetota bacterium]
MSLSEDKPQQKGIVDGETGRSEDGEKQLLLKRVAKKSLHDVNILTVSSAERLWMLLALAARLLLSGVLIYAGFSKLQSAWQFAEAIANFRILPAQFNQLLAVVLPWCELLTGLLILCGLWLRAAALVSTLMFAAFAVAVISAMARGLDIECGCFGTESASRAGLQPLAIDALCLATALVVMFSRKCKGE